jgi:mannose-6-phosphate isomerase-like protein (cupin superfamily)
VRLVSAKGVIAGSVVLFGLLAATARTQRMDSKDLSPEGAKFATAVNAVHSFVAGGPADSSPQATYFNSEKVAASFAKGSILLDGVGEGKTSRVSTRRRDKSGIGEVHTLDTDIVYVVEGTATFVTGGTLVSPKATAPDEIRGSAIEGGETYHLSKGDVIIVPNRVPHWFKEVPGPFLYFMVKVR